MQLSEFTFRLILLFLPGIIAFIIVDNLTIHRETKIHHWFFYSLILGFISYAPWFLLINAVQSVYGVALPFQFVSSIINPGVSINFAEILIASMTAVILGFFITWAITKRFLFRFASFFKITNKFPEIDAWDNLINTFDPEWITVRDFENQLSFQGKLVSTSDQNDRDGIVLKDVQVFNKKAEFQYRVPLIYIPKKMDSLLIEVPDVPERNKIQLEERKVDENGKTGRHKKREAINRRKRDKR